mmetsp:Transcript_14049/g.30421  ORF Transcript_14049/g.30421 Transcript_14049/m.30421 type:complete len:469 (+) Transcript_14049:131-1537(+)|eukprot:CAMPEP_0202897044 /NCGR_PEP_ID=MMETSP1392-20130828/5908_1 /ASSEMBLY_ACC=CAM_ASM_000868 /TAXON_ID=225041 /ORGANISM="Chlamydomonas chlamydogama, Strain SAG 11-48b" /LENGTH=468 /DNA_ID=CAMNT_0049582589 /DNA_START=64 /DNA_END=1470 /DNA_ORIENTATION=-
MFSWLFGQPQKPQEVTEAEKCYSKDELKHLQSQFDHALSKFPQGSKTHTLDAETFLHVLCGLPKRLDKHLARALTHVVTKGRPDGQVTCGDVVVAKARCSRMGEEVAQDFCFEVLAAAAGAGATTSTIHSSALEIAVAACAQLALGQVPPLEQIKFLAAGGILAGAEAGGSGNGGSPLTREGYAKWIKSCPCIHNLLLSLLCKVGPGADDVAARPRAEPSGQWVSLPEVMDLGKLAPEDIQLKRLWSWVLSSCMPPDLRKEWRCIYSSQRDGKSFSTLMGKLSASPGPTLLLARDVSPDGNKGNSCLFGGFAPQPWAKNGSFYGDFTTFIFKLEPTAQVFPATGINTNFQWCGVGFSQLPNGLGFGGAQGATNMGQFALYLDSTLDEGMSRPIATFGNTSLSTAQTFKVAAVECWLLAVPEPEEDSPHGNKKARRSVLDNAAQDRQFLGLAGVKVNNSEGVREALPEE